MTRKEIKEMKKRWREALATPTKPLHDPVPLGEIMDKYLEGEELCEDCISRKDAINAIKRTVATEQIKELKRLPSVQPKPKTGHWIEDDMTYCGVELVNYKCDKCGEMGGAWRKGLNPDKLPKYCMNCGAKMLPTDSEKE